jgi:hypothetical protein
MVLKKLNEIDKELKILSVCIDVIDKEQQDLDARLFKLEGYINVLKDILKDVKK